MVKNPRYLSRYYDFTLQRSKDVMAKGSVDVDNGYVFRSTLIIGTHHTGNSRSPAAIAHCSPRSGTLKKAADPVQRPKI